MLSGRFGGGFFFSFLVNPYLSGSRVSRPVLVCDLLLGWEPDGEALPEILSLCLG